MRYKLKNRPLKYIPDIPTDYSFRDITLIPPPPIYGPYLDMSTTRDYSLDNINLRLQPPPIMHSPYLEEPAIRDYSLDNIRLTPPSYTPPMHIYEPPAIIYEPPVYIPPPVIIDP